MEKNTFLMINDMIYDLYSCTSLNEIKAKFLLRLKPPKTRTPSASPPPSASPNPSLKQKTNT